MTTINGASALESASPTALGNNQTVPHPPPNHLPDEPLVIIQPSQSWAALDLREVWTYRGLLYFLMWRDVKVRYKQTALGVMWVILQPLLTTGIFTLFLGRMVGIASDGIPYALFVYSGMLPWMFFTSAVGSSSNSLVGNSHLITKVYFPRVLIPLAAIAARLLDLAVAFAVLIMLMAYYGRGVGPGILMLPVYVTLVILFALALGMLTSALNVEYRDIGVMIPFLLQLWMFASPVVYPLSLVPEKWRGFYSLNPMVCIIEGFRSALFGRGFDWSALATSSFIILIMLAGASFWFRRMQTRFADIV